MVQGYEIHPFTKIGFGEAFNNNFYVIVDQATQQAALVDPSWWLEGIEQFLKEHNLKLTTLLLTHSHFDHINLVQRLLKNHQPQVYMSAAEIDFYHFQCPNLHPLEHNDRIRVGETELRFLLTPGHTAGSGCYLLPDCLFTGDTIFIEGCGKCTSFGADPGQMFDSIQLIKEAVPPEVQVYPGHSYGQAIGLSLEKLAKTNLHFLTANKDTYIRYRNRKSWLNTVFKEQAWYSGLRRAMALSLRKSLFFVSRF